MLEPEILLRSEGLHLWFVKNLKTVVAVAGVLVLAGAAWGVVEILQHRAEEQAAGRYAEAMNTYHQALAPDRQLRVLSPETKEALDRAASAFQKVREDYPRTRHAALALFYQANAYAALDRFDDAITAYETWRAAYPHHALTPLVIQRLAYVLWAGGKPEEALARFNDVMAIPDAPNRDLASFEKGRLLEQMGQKEQALDAYTSLAKEFSSSPWSSEGNVRIIALGGIPPGQEADEKVMGSSAQPQAPVSQGEAQPPASPVPPPQ
jgi:predicted negative regulator of RcsB-dependent stress response